MDFQQKKAKLLTADDAILLRLQPEKVIALMNAMDQADHMKLPKATLTCFTVPEPRAPRQSLSLQQASLSNAGVT